MELGSARRSGESGISVIETLVALVLLGVGVAAVATGFTQGLRLSAESLQRQRAVWLAHEKLTSKLSVAADRVGHPVDTTERTVAAGLAGQDHVGGIARSWTVEIDRPSSGVATITVEVEWARRGERLRFRVGSLLADGRAE